MCNLNELLKELKVTDLAKAISIPYDTARMTFKVPPNTVKDPNEFCRITGDYVKHHNSGCISEDND